MLGLLIWEIRREGQGNEGGVLIPKEINRNKVQLDSANGSNDLESPCPKLVKSKTGTSLRVHNFVCWLYIAPRHGFIQSEQWAPIIHTFKKICFFLEKLYPLTSVSKLSPNILKDFFCLISPRWSFNQREKENGSITEVEFSGKGVSFRSSSVSEAEDYQWYLLNWGINL